MENNDITKTSTFEQMKVLGFDRGLLCMISHLISAVVCQVNSCQVNFISVAQIPNLPQAKLYNL